MHQDCDFDRDCERTLLQCVTCKQWKEQTSTFFVVNHRTQKNSFHTSFKNSITNPCKRCFAQLRACQESSGKGFVRRLLLHYDITIQQFEDLYTRQKGVGPISGVPLKLEAKGHNCVGIHRYDNRKQHVIDNIFLEVQEMNIAQRDAIPCLFRAWASLFATISNVQQSTSTQYASAQPILAKSDSSQASNVVKKWCSVLKRHIYRHVQEDVVHGRQHSIPKINRGAFFQIVYENALVKLEQQQYRCFYSNVPLTHVPSYCQFSFERINNKLSHFTDDGTLENVVFVCRLLNGPRQMSRAKILDYTLHQTLVPLSDEIRSKMQQDPFFQTN
jgi:hypothetical protein